MALRAYMIIIAPHVIGILDRCIFVLMTTVAASGRAGICGGMTSRTRHKRVRSGQREGRLVMIKLSRRPRSCTVTLGAGMTVVVRDVIRVLNSCVSVLMAAITVRDGSRPCSDVTGCTFCPRMRSCQCKVGLPMVKRHWCPSSRSMALSASMTAVAANMVRLRSGGKLVLMAAVAVRWSVRESRCMTG